LNAADSIFHVRNGMQKKAKEQWDVIVKSETRLFDFRFRELFKSKELIAVLVKRDFVSVYKQTILGPLWFVIQPLMTTIMYTFVFGNIAKMSTSGLPQTLFYFSGTMLWTFFSTNLIKSSDTFISNAPMFSKIYFPRLALPLSYVITHLRTFLIQLAVLLVLMGYFAANGQFTFVFSAHLLLIPLLILQTTILSIGVGILISAFTTKYRICAILSPSGSRSGCMSRPSCTPFSRCLPSSGLSTRSIPWPRFSRHSGSPFWAPVRSAGRCGASASR